MGNRARSLRAIGPAVLSAALAACTNLFGPGDPGVARDGGRLDAAPDPATVVGPAGGTIEGADGARLVVPPGAVASDTSISILPTGEPGPPGRALLGAVRAFLPHGTRFDVPVRIELPLPTTHAHAHLWTRPGDSPSWERVPSARTEDGLVIAEVDHFSYFALVDPGLVWERIHEPAADDRLLDLEVHRDGLLHLLTDRTVLRSPDGVTWTEIAAGLPSVDGVLTFTDLASTDLGVLLGTSRGLFRWDGSSWGDLSDGLPDDGFGNPARVSRITSQGSINTFLVASTPGTATTPAATYVRWWSPASGQWVALAETPGRGAIGAAALPHCLAHSPPGTTGFFCVSVPEGDVTRVAVTPDPLTAPIVFTISEAWWYDEAWLGTDQDVWRAPTENVRTGPWTHVELARGRFLTVRDILSLPDGEVLVATEDGRYVYGTTDGETFDPVGEGLPSEGATGSSGGVRRLASFSGTVLALMHSALYRARPSTLACGLDGDVCAADADCCAGTCAAGLCASGTCAPEGTTCRRSSGCCSAYCLDGACRAPPPDRCRTAGEACTTRGDCCRGDCVSGSCVDESHCRCDPAGTCGAPDGCGGTCPGSCPSGEACLEGTDGTDFCGVGCADWRDCRRVQPNDPEYCCVAALGIGYCAVTPGATCDTECAPEGAACGALAGLGCCDPDPTDDQRPYCCPPSEPTYGSTCSCVETVFE